MAGQGKEEGTGWGVMAWMHRSFQRHSIGRRGAPGTTGRAD